MRNNNCFIIIAFLFFVLFTSFLHITQEESALEWTSYQKLTWKDFIGSPIEDSSYDAVTTTSFLFKGMRWDKKGAKGSLIAVFFKQKSWTKSSNFLLLEHEQGHFDITEIYARKFRSKLKKTKLRNKFASKELQYIYHIYISEMEKWQGLYDVETNHGKNREKQEEWNKKISERLNELEEYREPVIQIKFR